MSLSPEDREALKFAASYGCGCFPDNNGLCESCRCSFDPTVAEVEVIVARHLADQHRAMCEYSLIEERGGMPCTYTGVVYRARINP